MEITYKWVVHGIYALARENDHDRVIKRVLYELEATDGTHTARVSHKPGWVDFEPVSDEEFRPFEDFTESMIHAWLDGAVPDQHILREEASQKIQDQYLEPITVTSLPWIKKE